MPSPLPRDVTQHLAPFGLDLDSAQIGRVCIYLELLLRWNERISLTSVRDPGEILSRHFGESLYLAKLLELKKDLLVDVGSGAGFPGLALKIICPELRVVLVESGGKKVAFLKEVVRTLQLRDIEFEQQRFERLAKDWKRGAVDIVTARAVGQYLALARNADRILRPKGTLALYLGRRDAEALVRDVASFTWSTCCLLPGAADRVILLGTKG